ncbi:MULTISPECIES: hypothetical protein [unclassified Sphingobacterium]|uniref:hypothetical protein n=1 Tax=unclassified Sphingobacterium TaxID=2609468 RepID=UPI0025FD3689|nr:MULTISPECIES: hypothetical protein [unclassified Sphingobacterium]
MATKEIIKVKVKDGIPEICYWNIYEDGNKGESIAKDPYLIHKDFQEAIDALRPHFALLCDLREADIIKKKIHQHHEEAFTHIRISGITISGTGDDQGVCIVGSKSYRSKVLPMTTPFEKFFDDYSDYRFKEELHSAIQLVQYEAEEYLNGKYRVQQMKMDFESHAEDME